MKIEIKKLIQSSKQSHYFVQLSSDIEDPSEIKDHPSIKEITKGKRLKFTRPIELEGNNWYLIVEEL